MTRPNVFGVGCLRSCFRSECPDCHGQLRLPSRSHALDLQRQRRQKLQLVVLLVAVQRPYPMRVVLSKVFRRRRWELSKSKSFKHYLPTSASSTCDSTVGFLLRAPIPATMSYSALSLRMWHLSCQMQGQVGQRKLATRSGQVEIPKWEALCIQKWSVGNNTTLDRLTDHHNQPALLIYPCCL